MYKKDRENMIKTLGNYDLKELVVPTYTYKEHKKKAFIKVLTDILYNEEEIACEYACDQCGVASDDSNMQTSDALKTIVKMIKEDRYSDTLFRNKKKNKVEVV